MFQVCLRRIGGGKGSGVGDHPVSRIYDGAGGDGGDDSGSWVGAGTVNVVGEGVCIEVSGGTRDSVSGQTFRKVDACLKWDGSGARGTSRILSSGEGRATLGVKSGACDGGVGGWEDGDVYISRGRGGVFSLRFIRMYAAAI